MKFLTFYEDDTLKVGISTKSGVLHLQKAADLNGLKVPADITEVIGCDRDALQKLAEFVVLTVEKQEEFSSCFIAENKLRFGPCLPKPGKIICVGLNYRKHAEETNAAIPQSPILFSKYANTIAAHGQSIILPKESDMVDYEAEMALVIGMKTQDVAEKDALASVFGYCNANDLSARDLQTRTSQWMLGKTCDGFAPIGPFLVTANEIENPNNLQIKSFVNGSVRQKSNTRDMIFSCESLISYISRHMTLEAGDIILTGTPEGVVFGMPLDQRVYLKDGDVVTVEVEKLGMLSNKMVSLVH